MPKEAGFGVIQSKHQVKFSSAEKSRQSWRDSFLGNAAFFLWFGLNLAGVVLVLVCSINLGYRSFETMRKQGFMPESAGPLELLFPAQFGTVCLALGFCVLAGLILDRVFVPFLYKKVQCSIHKDAFLRILEGQRKSLDAYLEPREQCVGITDTNESELGLTSGGMSVLGVLAPLFLMVAPFFICLPVSDSLQVSGPLGLWWVGALALWTICLGYLTRSKQFKYLLPMFFGGILGVSTTVFFSLKTQTWVPLVWFLLLGASYLLVKKLQRIPSSARFLLWTNRRVLFLEERAGTIQETRSALVPQKIVYAPGPLANTWTLLGACGERATVQTVEDDRSDLELIRNSMVYRFELEEAPHKRFHPIPLSSLGPLAVGSGLLVFLLLLGSYLKEYSTLHRGFAWRRREIAALKPSELAFQNYDRLQRQAAAHFPKDPVFHLIGAEMALKKGNSRKALRSLDQAKRWLPETQTFDSKIEEWKKKQQKIRYWVELLRGQESAETAGGPRGAGRLLFEKAMVAWVGAAVPWAQYPSYDKTYSWDLREATYVLDLLSQSLQKEDHPATRVFLHIVNLTRGNKLNPFYPYQEDLAEFLQDALKSAEGLKTLQEDPVWGKVARRLVQVGPNVHGQIWSDLKENPQTKSADLLGGVTFLKSFPQVLEKNLGQSRIETLLTHWGDPEVILETLESRIQSEEIAVFPIKVNPVNVDWELLESGPSIERDQYFKRHYLR